MHRGPTFYLTDLLLLAIVVILVVAAVPSCGVSLA